MVDAPIEFDAAALQEFELFQPGCAVGQLHRDVIDRDAAAGELPFFRRRHVRALDQCDVVMGVLAVVIGAVEAHLRQRHPRARPQGRDLLHADDLGPEAVRLLDVADIEHDVVDAARPHRRASGFLVCHRCPP